MTLSQQRQSSHRLSPVCGVHFTLQLTLCIFISTWPQHHLLLAPLPYSSIQPLSGLPQPSFLTAPHLSLSSITHPSPELQLVRTLPFPSSGTLYLRSAYFKQLRSCSDLRKRASRLSASPCFSFCTKLGHPWDLWKEDWRSHSLLHTLPGLHPSRALLAFLKALMVKEDACIMKAQSSFLSYSQTCTFLFLSAENSSALHTKHKIKVGKNWLCPRSRNTLLGKGCAMRMISSPQGCSEMHSSEMHSPP